MTDQLLSFFVTSAYAEGTAGTPQQGGGMSLLLMFVVFFLFMYFVMIRPQSKRAKEQQQLLNSLSKGDEVITAGGLLGKITKLSEQYLTILIASNVEIVVQKAAVVNVLPKGTLKSIE